MKKLLLSLSVTLSMTLFAFAHNGDPINNEPKGPSTISFNDIFISDYEGEALYVDFEAVADQIIAINLVKDEKLMMEDNVQDLPDNTIYELNLGILAKGVYKIELLTQEGISIQKRIVID